MCFSKLMYIPFQNHWNWIHSSQWPHWELHGQ